MVMVTALKVFTTQNIIFKN